MALEYVEKCYRPTLWLSKRLPSVRVRGYPSCIIDIEPVGVKRNREPVEDENPVFLDLFLV